MHICVNPFPTPEAKIDLQLHPRAFPVSVLAHGLAVPPVSSVQHESQRARQIAPFGGPAPPPDRTS